MDPEAKKLPLLNYNVEQPVSIKDEIEIGDTLLLHGDSYVENNKIECDVELILLQPRTDSTNLKINQDENCDEIIVDEDQIDNATSKSVQEKRIQCQFCDHTTSNFYEIRDHIDTVHFGYQNHKCEYCDFTSVTSEDLNNHITSAHQQFMRQSKQQSKHCDLTFSVTSLKQVPRVHKLKIYKCCLCDYSATRSSKISIHMEDIHQKPKYYKCDYCNYSTSLTVALETHVRNVHTKILEMFNEYKCMHCNYTSGDYKEFKKHVSTAHMKKRIDIVQDKVVRCERCDYTTTRSTDMQQHLRNAHREENHECELCDYSTSKISELKEHVASHFL